MQRENRCLIWASGHQSSTTSFIMLTTIQQPIDIVDWTAKIIKHLLRTRTKIARYHNYYFFGRLSIAAKYPRNFHFITKNDCHMRVSTWNGHEFASSNVLNTSGEKTEYKSNEFCTKEKTPFLHPFSSNGRNITSRIHGRCVWMITRRPCDATYATTDRSSRFSWRDMTKKDCWMHN